MKNTKCNRGYITVEAAIFLPVFIIAVLTVGSLIKTTFTHESFMYNLADEARKISLEAYAAPSSAIAYADCYSRLNEEKSNLGQGVCELFIEPISYMYCDNGISDLIKINFNYKYRSGLPSPMKKQFRIRDGVLFRAFTGRNNSGQVVSFNEMANANDSQIVWVFPQSGTRYHCKECQFISNYPQQCILTDDIRSRYAPCSKCKPGDCGNGSIVYCFTKAGEVFHSGECNTVDKYTMPMDREEAESNGYTPCQICGGG